MLNDLLSLRQRDMLWHRFPELVRHPEAEPDKREFEPLTDAVYTLYHCGRGFPEGHPFKRGLRTDLGEHMWEHAEDFLDFLDGSVENAHTRARLEQMWEAYWSREREAKRWSSPSQRGRSRWKFELPAAEALLAKAKRLVAAECSLFTFEGAEKLEKWSPFFTWAENLTGNDWIISFNYDRVLELLALDPATHISSRSSFVVDRYDTAFRASQNCAEVLKLHGSVDWLLASERSEARYFGRPEHELRFIRGDTDEALRCPDNGIAIATPGPTKRRIAEDEFSPLWSQARDQLQKADAVVFLGYRFPPTDAMAREVLLGAIEENERPHIDLHVVLGPRKSEDVERLEEMLRYVGRRAGRQEEPTAYNGGRSFRVVRHALWSQDFLQLVTRRDLIWWSLANPRWEAKPIPQR